MVDELDDDEVERREFDEVIIVDDVIVLHLTDENE